MRREARYAINRNGELCEHGEPMSPRRCLLRLEEYERELEKQRELLRRADAALAEALGQPKEVRGA